MLKRITVLALVLTTALAVACGGSDNKGGALSGGSSTDPKVFTTQYYTTIFAALAGSKSGQDLANFFPPACRDNVKIADINRGIQDEQQQVPKIKGAKIDNVDFGDKFKSTKKDTGFTINVPASRDSKIHVDGKWVNAHDYLVSVEFETDNSGSTVEDLNLITVDNKLFVDDCDSLESIAKPENTPTPTPRSGTATPTPRSGGSSTPTPTTSRTTPTPGSSGTTGNLSTADATTYARSYFVTILGALAGTKTAQDVINVYAPECQKQVKVADVAKGISTEAKNYPKLAGAKVDDFDFGNNVTVKKGSNGFTVTVPSSKDTKVKIGGTTQNLHTYLLGVGLEDNTDGNDTTDITVVVVSGKAYNGDCDELNAIATN